MENKTKKIRVMMNQELLEIYELEVPKEFNEKDQAAIMVMLAGRVKRNAIRANESAYGEWKFVEAFEILPPPPPKKPQLKSPEIQIQEDDGEID